MLDAVLKSLTQDPSLANSMLLSLILLGLVLERATHYFFEWRKSSRPLLPVTNPHTEKMADMMASLAQNQKVTARAIESMTKTVGGIKQDTVVLLDRTVKIV